MRYLSKKKMTHPLRPIFFFSLFTSLAGSSLQPESCHAGRR
jgi:hypothetical protein